MSSNIARPRRPRGTSPLTPNQSGATSPFSCATPLTGSVPPVGSPTNFVSCFASTAMNLIFQGFDIHITQLQYRCFFFTHLALLITLPGRRGVNVLGQLEHGPHPVLWPGVKVLHMRVAGGARRVLEGWAGNPSQCGSSPAGKKRWAGCKNNTRQQPAQGQRSQCQDACCWLTPS